nr:uncharacterized protein LOC120963603 [Aegilops tauschii subsp. strangulata]
MMDHLQQQLKHAQDRMKKQPDKHRTDRSFEVGDLLYLRLQPFIQTSVAQWPYQKLAFRYYGPYPVIAQIGKVAYKLQLPVDSKIHPVVHVSQLKKAISPGISFTKSQPANNSGRVIPPEEHSLKVKRSKCLFAQQQIIYLGHKISSDGVAMDDSKIESVRDWPRPESVRKLREFWGLAGYYRKFVRNFGIISRPLTDMLKKGTLFIWTPTAETAFNELKKALVQAPVLALPDFTKKALAPRNLEFSAYEKECLALMLAVDHWCPYLQHAEFLVRTDQKSLLHLTDQRLNTPIQQRAFTKLVGLQFQIQYKTGITNKAADALSRRDHWEEGELAAVSVCRPAWLEAVASSYRQDTEAQRKLEQLTLDPTSDSDYALQDGVIRHKGRIWIGSYETTQLALIKALHDSAIGGHSRFYATYHRVKNLFSWKGCTPFEVIYGHLPREFAFTQVEESSVPDLSAWLQERAVMMDHLQQQLKHAQDRMKKQPDKHRTDRSFEVGDLLYLRLQPFIQTSVAQRPYQKLAFRYYGPYPVIAQIGKVAYKLQLPVDSKIHPVVHVSQLKKAISPGISVSPSLPPANSVLQEEHFREAILATKFIKTQGEMRPRLLVQWSEISPSLGTWEEPADLRRHFPASTAWGQAETQGGECHACRGDPDGRRPRRGTGPGGS